MTNIYLIKRSKIRYSDNKFPLLNTVPPVWHVPLTSGIIADAKLLNSNQIIEVTISNHPIASELHTSLVKNEPENFDSFTKEEQNALCKITKLLGEASDKVLGLIKYHFNHQDLSEELTRGKEIKWSVDYKSWRKLPEGVASISLSIHRAKLTPTKINNIQKSLDANITPLTAMRHLHRAHKELQPHHKWIEATIAAELAVKEVLIRANPELETILLELPSPPLTKLYGTILERYLGERSPFVSKIGRGVEVRNRLVHRPNEERIDLKSAFDYVDTIEAAIFHLLTIIYPEDRLLQETSKKLHQTK
ncbi:MAG: hypothetical protein ACI8ZB_005254 [Desulforhopalus sp.]|jgi:hypothetical protein